MTESRVFVGQLPNKPVDLSSAARYGVIMPIFEIGDRPSLLPAQHLMKARKVLRDFEEERDYILWAGGDPIAPFLIGTALRELPINSYTYLRWEKERGLDGRRNPNMGYYVPVKVRLKEAF
jgi:hypothetical protein